MVASRMMNDLHPNNTGKVTQDQLFSGLTVKARPPLRPRKFTCILATRLFVIFKKCFHTASAYGEPQAGMLPAICCSLMITNSAGFSGAKPTTMLTKPLSMSVCVVVVVSQRTKYASCAD